MYIPGKTRKFGMGMGVCKKAAPKLQLQGGSVQGLHLNRGLYTGLLYQIPSKNASPNLDGGGGGLPVSWEFVFTAAGVVWAVDKLFRLIDWIERS